MKYFIENESSFSKRPENGYTYIYIYSIGNMYLYVGQAIQSIEGRFKQHLSDHSGVHYADTIRYLQVKSEYANYTEGYLAYRLNGICQGNIPNHEHHKDSTPIELRKELQKIANKLVSMKSFTAGPVFSISIKNDGSNCEDLSMFHQLLNCGTLLWDNFTKNGEHSKYIFMNEFTLAKSEKIKMNHRIFIVTRTKGKDVLNRKIGLRPMAFLRISSVAELLDVKHIKSDYPCYCIVTDEFYKKYDKFIDAFYKKSHIGLLVQDWKEIRMMHQYKKPYASEHKDLIAKEVAYIAKATNYIAQDSPFGYFQCA